MRYNTPLERSLFQKIKHLKHEKAILLDALKKMISHASCACGGFSGGEFVAQPCNICEKEQKVSVRSNN